MHVGDRARRRYGPPPFPGAVTHALVASFNFATQYNVEVLTQTTPPGQVNLTGFSQLRFNAKLLSTTPGTASALPPGTVLHVELRAPPRTSRWCIKMSRSLPRW